MDISRFPKTKIVCTLGPSSSSPHVIEQLIEAGMNVARLNFSHGDHEMHAANITMIREISAAKKVQIAILQDLQGPKIRTGKLKNNGMILTNGQKVRLIYGYEQTDNEIPIDHRDLVHDVHVGAQVLLDDGLMAMKVTAIDGQEVEAEVIHGGFLKSRKGVNFPECKLSIPAMTEKDIKDLLFGVSQNVDFIALSFVQTPQDVLKLKKMLRSLGADIPVITKVEMLGAIHHLEEICKVSDGIMVARGDLGVECGFAKVSIYQKHIIETSIKHGKPVIVATQMLDSMIENRRPTKSEVCDVANAAFDKTDATMLSGETASGKYPVLAVQTMRDILDRVDNVNMTQVMHSNQLPLVDSENISHSEIFSTTIVEIADKLKANAIVCLSLSGNIARSIAKYRPNTHVIAFSPRLDVVRKLNLVRGVTGIMNTIFYDTDTAFSEMGKFLLKRGLVKENDLILITGGIPVSQMHPTNTIKIHRVQKNDLH